MNLSIGIACLFIGAACLYLGARPIQATRPWEAFRSVLGTIGSDGDGSGSSGE